MPSPACAGASVTSVILALVLATSPALAWSNGGYSADPADPDYGTHDWIAEHALAWLPAADKAYLTANRIAYLYGTELPDNAGPPDGIGDQFNHHVYCSAAGALQDDVGAARAAAQYDAALAFLQAGDEPPSPSSRPGTSRPRLPPGRGRALRRQGRGRDGRLPHGHGLLHGPGRQTSQSGNWAMARKVSSRNGSSCGLNRKTGARMALGGSLRRRA